MIVSNTTPISNLLHADNISLLAKLFGTVYIPDAVANEVNVVFSSCA
jgi:predicted nucleic acid-binding protein